MTHYSFHADNVAMSEKDYRKAFINKALKAKKSKIITVLAFLIVFFGLQFYQQDPIRPFHFIAAILGCIVVIVFVTIIDVIAVTWTSKRLKDDALFKLTFSIQSEEEGFKTSSERGDTLFQWPDFRRYFESKEAFMLETKSRICFLITKQSFDRESLDNFRRALENNVNK